MVTEPTTPLPMRVSLMDGLIHADARKRCAQLLYILGFGGLGSAWPPAICSARSCLLLLCCAAHSEGSSYCPRLTSVPTCNN